MQSIRELFRVGVGPSSSHTMAPRRAAELFKARVPGAARHRVTLYGSLAATGKGHLTDVAVRAALAPAEVEVVFRAGEQLPRHPNGLLFEAFDAAGSPLASWRAYSVGGGALEDDEGTAAAPPEVYDLTTMGEILDHCDQTGRTFWEYVEEREGPEIWDFLREVLRAMEAAVDRGLRAQGVLPGGLGLPRKAWTFHRKAEMSSPLHMRREGLLFAYALAVSEENAVGGVIVTAPTCGSCGVLPAVLRGVRESLADDDELAALRALATAGLVGDIVKKNASISGAEVGCQGEVGVACAMAAAAAAQLLAGTVRQIEYAAEMGLEHHLGLTCDPVAGLVQIPCIERNVFAAARAVTCAEYALLSDGSHRIPFDDVVAVMRDTGRDLPLAYRETAFGGLAAAYARRHAPRLAAAPRSAKP
ncbi:MAG: L-serine ammonia-lyase, iron-sulfur-dependent, subunit alpha [Candidatus Polarisedimenticolia bacterium]|nr:L-serine ammonia-lyase, iron-sulfur-dependent, subunit alpha [bacterium]